MFGKQKKSKEEIQSLIAELETLGDVDGYPKALELEKYAPEEAAYFLGLYQLNGIVVPKNPALCLSYMQKHLKAYPDKHAYAWHYGAFVYFSNGDYVNAVNWYSKAAELGIKEAYASVAFCEFKMANELRTHALRAVKISVFNEYNTSSAQAFLRSAQRYMALAATDSWAMADLDWIAFGRDCDYLLAMAYQGQLTDLGITNNSLSSYLKAGLNILNAKTDEKQNDEMKSITKTVCQVMDDAGKSLYATTFRAYYSLREARFENSNVAYYRATWFYTRAQQLLETASQVERDSWYANIDDLTPEYNKMGERYRLDENNFMLDGITPDLKPFFRENETPDCEINTIFMKNFNRIRNTYKEAGERAKQASSNPQPAKKGLFGFLKK